MAPDRRTALAAQGAVTGIDFVLVSADQRHLQVFFLNDPLALAPPLSSLAASQVSIHEDLLGAVPVDGLGWQVVDGRNVLRIDTAGPGGFRPYRLRIEDPRIDPFFNDVVFDFKASCPSELDCRAAPAECAAPAPADVVLDTTARDWASLQRALLDFASHRYPEWKDRLEADVGVMLADVMAAVGDEMAYFQDRIAREASLESATQRRSLRRHARLVDYELHDGLGATGWLDLQLGGAPGTQLVDAGADVWAESSSGAMVDGVFVPRRVPFEIGRGLADVLAGAQFRVDVDLNALPAHVWDESQTCLPVGATEMWVDGHHAAALEPGQWVLIQTDPADPARPARRHLVRLVLAEDRTDPLGGALGISSDVTRLVWEEAQPLPFEIDLEARCTVHGNLVPITAGKTRVERFSIGPTAIAGMPRAVERTGPRASFAYLFTLPDPGDDGLVRRGDPRDPRAAVPEIHLVDAGGQRWDWRRSLIGVKSAHPEDEVFTLDDGTWGRVVGYQRLGGEIVHVDYRDGAGVTIRFGDGEFGLPPRRGSEADPMVFSATYRLGNGARGNLPAGSVRRWDTTDPSLLGVVSVSNPLPTGGGAEPETAADVRQLAPDAFRAITYRAVRAEDYADAAERLPWVQRAGATFRWTGSWLSAMVTPDPRGAVALAPARRRGLEQHLDRFRQAGREVIVADPRYADLDLAVLVCVASTSYPGDVVTGVLERMFGRRGARPSRGFFDPDHFTFGTPLDRSELEAAIQSVPGVKAVEHLALRRRGHFGWRLFASLAYRPGADEVIRVMNDRAHPDRGSLRVLTQGGA